MNIGKEETQGSGYMIGHKQIECEVVPGLSTQSHSFSSSKPFTKTELISELDTSQVKKSTPRKL